MNDPVDRSPEFDPPQLILSRDFSFLQLGDAALDLTQLFLRVGEAVLVNGENLQPRFRDLATESWRFAPPVFRSRPQCGSRRAAGLARALPAADFAYRDH